LTCHFVLHAEPAVVWSAHRSREPQPSSELLPSCRMASTDARTAAKTGATGVDLFVHIDRLQQDRRMT
jgi:hypothetical protein